MMRSSHIVWTTTRMVVAGWVDVVMVVNNIRPGRIHRGTVNWSHYVCHIPLRVQNWNETNHYNTTNIILSFTYNCAKPWNSSRMCWCPPKVPTPSSKREANDSCLAGAQTLPCLDICVLVAFISMLVPVMMQDLFHESFVDILCELFRAKFANDNFRW